MPNLSPTSLPPILRGHAVSLAGHPATAARELPLRAVASHRRPSGVVYTPFAQPGVIGLMIGTNMQRLAAGKAPLPLIARDTHACRTLLAIKQGGQQCLEQERATAQRQLLSGLTSSRTVRQLTADERQALREKMQLHGRQIASLKQLQIVSNQHGAALAPLKPGDNKIYLLAHGAPGGKTLSMPSKFGPPLRITAPQLAKQLQLGQLRPDFYDIRVRSCFSADAQPPRSFAPADLEAAARPHGNPTSPAYTQAFGQRLSNALADVGFLRPEVTAYHGGGAILDVVDGHKLRTLMTTNEQARESSVSRVFRPEH